MMKKLGNALVFMGFTVVYVGMLAALFFGLAHALACPEWFPTPSFLATSSLEELPEPHTPFYRSTVKQVLDRNYWARINTINKELQRKWTLNDCHMAIGMSLFKHPDCVDMVKDYYNPLQERPMKAHYDSLRFELPESPWENTVVLHPDGTYRVWETKDGKIWGYGEVIEPVVNE